MLHYTEEEQHRRTLSNEALLTLRKSLEADLVAAGGDPERPWRTNIPASETLGDIERILQRRRNKDTATAMMQHPRWASSWKYQIGRLALEMVDAHAEHCGNARNALRHVAYGDPRAPRPCRAPGCGIGCNAGLVIKENGRSIQVCFTCRGTGESTKDSVKETSDAWSDRYDVLRFICETLPVEEADPVIVAFRHVLEDRKEPLYGWRNKEAVGEPPEPVDPAEKARADERLARYFAVWKALEDVVEDTARCGCIGTEHYCDHVGRCKEAIAGLHVSNFYCDSCCLNAQAESQ